MVYCYNVLPSSFSVDLIRFSDVQGCELWLQPANDTMGTETETQTRTERDRDREREAQRQRQRERERQREERERERDRESDRE